MSEIQGQITMDTSREAHMFIGLNAWLSECSFKSQDSDAGSLSSDYSSYFSSNK